MKTKLALVSMMLLGGVPAIGMATSRTVTLVVPGMTCPTCPITLKHALEKVAGVSTVTSDIDKKTMTVTYDDAKTRPMVLMRATADAGYPSTMQH